MVDGLLGLLAIAVQLVEQGNKQRVGHAQTQFQDQVEMPVKMRIMKAHKGQLNVPRLSLFVQVIIVLSHQKNWLHCEIGNKYN